ncbi:Peroxidase 50 [Ancistrocladus abbreviatus]
MIQSTPNNQAEKDHPDNLSLAGDGFDTVIKTKAAVDDTPGYTNKVSCADILAIATRDVINLAGGLFCPVELGRLDGLVSTAAMWMYVSLAQTWTWISSLPCFAEIGLS